jgi:hypothetical protein
MAEHDDKVHVTIRATDPLATPIFDELRNEWSQFYADHKVAEAEAELKDKEAGAETEQTEEDDDAEEATE